MYPKKFFSENDIEEVSGRCFLLMPFTEDLRAVHDALRQVLTCSDLNLTCVRADDISRGGHILEDILRGIEEAEILIVDLTGRNPNVFYELGVAHTRKDVSNVILIDQSMGLLPFDIGPYRCISYENSEEGLGKLKKEIGETVRSIVGSDIRFTIATGQPFVLPRKLLGKDLYMYELAVPPSYVDQGIAKVQVKLIRLAPGEPPEEFFCENLGFEEGNSRELGTTGFLLTLERAADGQGVFNISKR